MEFNIKITNGASPNDGVFVGDVFLARNYFLCPEKYTLIRKISGSKKKYDKESMNHYKEDATKQTPKTKP